MKVVSFIMALVVPVFVFAHSEHEHGPETQVVIESDVEGVVQAGSIELSFRMVDTEREQIIKTDDLEVTHEKKLHMFIFDEALLEFQHVHPEFNVERNRWVVTVALPKNGNYGVWAQGTLRLEGSEKIAFTTSMRLETTGGEPANPLPPQLNEKRVGNDGESIVTLGNNPFRAGKMSMLTLAMTRGDGTEPQITPFLGAKAHVIGVLSDGDALVHEPSMEHGNKLMVHMVFPEAGNYRLWVQYIDGGVLRTIPLAVRVR